MSEKKYRIKDGFILREIAGECMIIPSDPDSDIKNGVLSPNTTAYSLWKIFQNPSTVDDAVVKILEEYEVSESQARESIIRFVEELSGYRILEEVE